MIKKIFIIVFFIFIGCDQLVEKTSPLDGIYYVLDGWENQNIQSNLTINIADDCNDVLGGNDQIDDCYDCKDPLDHNEAMDCNGLCYGPGQNLDYWYDNDGDFLLT